jgi:membrane protease YdiL (CAAX protease family)
MQKQILGKYKDCFWIRAIPPLVLLCAIQKLAPYVGNDTLEHILNGPIFLWILAYGFYFAVVVTNDRPSWKTLPDIVTTCRFLLILIFFWLLQLAGNYIFLHHGFFAGSHAREPEKLAATILRGSVFAPFFEEIVFRGLFLPLLISCLQLLDYAWLRRSSVILAILIQSTVFGLVHSETPIWFSIIFQGSVGVFLSFTYLATRSLWLVIALHVVSNSLSTFVPIVAESTINSYAAEYKYLWEIIFILSSAITFSLFLPIFQQFKNKVFSTTFIYKFRF